MLTGLAREDFGMIPLLTALGVFVLVALAEWLHARIRVAGRLAFGPAGAAAAWTRVVPLLRVASFTAMAWGLMTLFLISMKPEPVNDAVAKERKDAAATRLVFVADLSPSMYLADAGPDGTQTRAVRAREVVEAILQRVSGNLKFGVIGFYTEALPVVMEARDPELVRNVFNGLPLSYGMPVGQTDLGKAVNATVDLVKDFPPGSVRMIILTDGDSVNLVPITPRPKSIKEVLVLGVGNPRKGMYIDGHQSRQEGETLQRVATSLMGTYEDVNTKHLATSALGDLVVPLGPPHNGFSLAQLAVFAIVLGALINALIAPALEYYGSDWTTYVPERDRGEAKPARPKEAALVR
jgi:Ca-activated chloride channel family protein